MLLFSVRSIRRINSIRSTMRHVRTASVLIPMGEKKRLRAKSRLAQTNTRRHEVSAKVKFRNFARGPEFALSATRSTRATNLWAGSSNKTYVEHDSPSVSERESKIN